ncbi:MAG TPA: TonB-dependent receptor, partial [Gemmatimonadaceae bacterium]
IRPRYNAVSKSGRSLFATAGYGYDDRDGGTVARESGFNRVPFREGLRSDRADVGATAEIPLKSGKIATRFALSSNWREREFGVGPVERDRTSTGFLEVTRSFVSEPGTTVLGAALQADVFKNELNDQFDRRWLTPALFATSERNLGPLIVSASVRGDVHQDAGTQLTERLAVLIKPREQWSIRGSVGTGFAAATATTEETEAIGLRAVRRAADMKAEKSRAAMIDINGEVAGAEILITGYASRIDNALQMRDATDGSGIAFLQNARGSTRISGVEALSVWRFKGGKFIGSYGYSYGTRPDAETGGREIMPLITRHRIGGDLMLERPGVYRAGIEGMWYGPQALDDNPYRSRSKPYTYVMAIAARQIGAFELVANFENLLNVRQTDTDPLVRPWPTPAGRWTTDVWAPLEGFMANVAVRYRWQ